jgi:hypothetical protein
MRRLGVPGHSIAPEAGAHTSASPSGYNRSTTPSPGATPAASGGLAPVRGRLDTLRRSRKLRERAASAPDPSDGVMPVSFDLFVVSEREDGLLEGSLLHLPWLGLGGDIHLWLLEPTRPPHLWHSVDYEIRERKWTPPEESVVLRISQPALERLRAWRRERAEEVIARARDRGLMRVYLYPGFRGASLRQELKRLVRWLVGELRRGRLLFMDVE